MVHTRRRTRDRRDGDARRPGLGRLGDRGRQRRRHRCRSACGSKLL